MNKYYVTYSIDAYTIIEAENDIEAQKQFLNGEYIDNVTEVNLHNIELDKVTTGSKNV